MGIFVIGFQINFKLPPGSIVLNRPVVCRFHGRQNPRFARRTRRHPHRSVKPRHRKTPSDRSNQPLQRQVVAIVKEHAEIRLLYLGLTAQEIRIIGKMHVLPVGLLPVRSKFGRQVLPIQFISPNQRCGFIQSRSCPRLCDIRPNRFVRMRCLRFRQNHGKKASL